ncbi:DUF3253 domain-containing protein [Paeniroseomonas aquatica]|uniref:DUF3253 domain-containing protein n=1 Tax=Paeniroseomonas aquatica TaxID=373043 RepID=A0ABT8A9T8_9PROT|nr:DUF3253 domain-containing protein [Paeniroseomonas aquatica]MDN3566573.1 DUF3253 domain-containing protein [Paeniroseomonas aquatica]
MSIPTEASIAAEILRLTAERGPDKSICPSEVARALAGGDDGPWRPLMTPVRQAALVLQQAGAIEILRKGKAVPAEQVRGVIRLRQAPPEAASRDQEAALPPDQAGTEGEGI